MPMLDTEFSRRRFLQFSAAGAGVVAATPYLSQLEALAAPPVGDTQGILVTVFLGGGNDGMNTVAPVGNSRYAQLRPSLRITNGLSIGSGLALHPALTKLKTRFDVGKVAVVQGVGYQPPDLSHFESQDIWMHGWGGSGQKTTGWAGRFLDGLPNTEKESLYGVSLHGNVNLQLSGAVANPSSLPLRINDAFGIDRSDRSDARMFDAVKSFGSGTTTLGALGAEFNESQMELMNLTQRIRPAYGFSEQPSYIEQQLVLAAHLINANLGIRVIDTVLDGFDTHSDQAGWHATLMGRLDNAIDKFFKTLSTRWKGQVCLMTWSEFGRRPEENGDAGTDHGAAAPLFVIGDKVRGGVHGSHPSLTNLDNHGDLRPSVDFRQVYAPIIDTWLKGDDRQILGKTYSPIPLFKSGPSAPAVNQPSTIKPGYWIAGPTGHITGKGAATKFGPLPSVTSYVIGGAPTPTRKGLWLVSLDGRVYSVGDAGKFGHMGGKHLNKPIVAMSANAATGKGYWLCASDGGIFTFGDARYYGSTGNIRLNKPIVAFCSTPSGKGYWFCASDGGIFTYGNARFYGSTGAKRISSPIVSMACTPSGKGYWFCAANGTVYPFGDAKYHGGKPNLGAPIISIQATDSGKGYWLLARNGRVASFGDATVLGSIADTSTVLVAQ